MRTWISPVYIVKQQSKTGVFHLFRAVRGMPDEPKGTFSTVDSESVCGGMFRTDSPTNEKAIRGYEPVYLRKAYDHRLCPKCFAYLFTAYDLPAPQLPSLN